MRTGKTTRCTSQAAALGPFVSGSKVFIGLIECGQPLEYDSRMDRVYDYIVIGAGSAGCVMATRLAKNHRVLLLEAGRANPSWDFRVHMPAALSEVLKGTWYNWAYNSLPEPYMNDRVMYCPRGKVLGGSSSINGMIFVRGNPQDFNRWSEVYGATGWSYSDVLPFFKMSETKQGGDPQFRGDSGPVQITNGETDSPLCQAWLGAGQELGFDLTDDFNGARQEGFGPFDRSIAHGRRQSTAVAYLSDHAAAPDAPGLTVMTKTQVQKVDLESGRVKGVTVLLGGRLISVEAEREVICAAGAINSPQLLMLSGIGPEAELKKHDIVCHVASEEVGQNLQDHLEVYVQADCQRPVSLYPVTRGLGKLLVGARWYFFNQGPGATNHFHTGAFLRSGYDPGYPDLQFHFLPVAMDYDGKDQHKGHGFQAHVGPMKPTSRGQVTLRDANPMQAPNIQFNYNATEQDQRVMRQGIDLARELIASRSFNGLAGKELKPGVGNLEDFIRERGESAYHPSGTCRMGADSRAVTDLDGRVKGVRGLRVVDASLMPEITNGNLNAVVIMMAEKIAAGMTQS